MTQKRGRPALPDEEKRVPFTIRMTPYAIEKVKRLASKDKTDASSWARDRLREAVEAREPRGRAVP